MACWALTAGMCGTQLARTTPLMKKIIETAQRERVSNKCFRADAAGEEFICRALLSFSRFVGEGWVRVSVASLSAWPNARNVQPYAIHTRLRRQIKRFAIVVAPRQVVRML